MDRIRVLVVDDSVVIRRLVSDLLAADPELEVIGTAVNGRAAVEKVAQLRPDLVTMDIEMPEIDGIEAVRRIRASGNRVPVIMFSTLTERGAVATLDALAAGASDYVAKPANVGSVSRSMDQVREALIPRIKALAPRPAAAGTSTRAPAPTRADPVPVAPPRLLPRRSAPPGGHRLLVIGSSTGGPEALSTFLTALPPLPVPIAIVQHMPPVFTRQLAARLDRLVPAEVVEAEDGVVLRAGTVHIAPGDIHLGVLRQNGELVSRLSRTPPENYCRPAVDVLFRTAADTVGSPILGVVLTGMGQDGRRGAERIVAAGGSLVVQDADTSVVWGMPGAVANAGLAEDVLPLDEIAPEVVRRLGPHAACAATRGTTA